MTIHPHTHAFARDYRRAIAEKIDELTGSLVLALTTENGQAVAIARDLATARSALKEIDRVMPAIEAADHILPPPEPARARRDELVQVRQSMHAGCGFGGVWKTRLNDFEL